jgi:hypothetical protein
MKNESCYIINFYLGDRRCMVEEYSSDKLYFLKTQIELLSKYKTSLSKIIFSFNIRQEDYPRVSEIFEITPKFIQGIPVEINFRENFGMSYGAWSDIFGKYKEKYDYYIFNEDDYFFVQDDWDSYLINKFNSFGNCGYLCMVSRDGSYEWCSYKKHAGHSTGISSFEVLNKVYEKYGELPHAKENDYLAIEQLGQINQSYAVIEVGYDIYDVRDDYRVAFAYSGFEYDIWRFFWWNNKDLVIPALLLKDYNYSYWISHDVEFDPYPK